VQIALVPAALPSAAEPAKAATLQTNSLRNAFLLSFACEDVEQAFSLQGRLSSRPS
jgi:hypothetical protein